MLLTQRQIKNLEPTVENGKMVFEYQDPEEYFDSLFAHDLFYQAKPCWLQFSEWWRTPEGVDQLEGMRAGMPNFTKSRIGRLIKEGNTAIAWITANGAIVHIPTRPVQLFIAGVDASFFDSLPVLIIYGATGLSAIPEWGDHCRQVHNMDWAAHDSLWNVRQP